MTTATLLLVLASAAIHAVWNLWAKEMRSVARGASIAWLLTILSAAVYAPVALVMFARSGWRPTPESIPWILGSSFIHVAYFLLLLRGYRVGDLSLVYPTARGTGPLWAAAGGVVLLGERLTPLSVAGALLVALAVLLLTYHRPDPARPRGPGILYGLLTGLLIGTYTLWDGWAVKRVGLPPLLYYWAGEVVRIGWYAPLALGDRAGLARAWGTHRARVLGIAVLSPPSYILMLVAMRTGALSHIAPAREIGILFGTWLGGQVLGEGDRTRRLSASMAFVAGVVALALA